MSRTNKGDLFFFHFNKWFVCVRSISLNKAYDEEFVFKAMIYFFNLNTKKCDLELNEYFALRFASLLCLAFIFLLFLLLLLCVLNFIAMKGSKNVSLPQNLYIYFIYKFYGFLSEKAVFKAIPLRIFTVQY